MPDTTFAPDLTQPGNVLEVPEQLDYFYQAVGKVHGVFCVDPFRLQTDETTLPLSVPKRFQELLAPSQEVTLGVYPAWGKEGLFFRVFSCSKAVPTTPLEFRLDGCWRQTPQGERLLIYRNPGAMLWGKPRPLALPLVWPDAPPADGLFWRLTAHLVEGNLVVCQAQGPFSPPPKLQWR
jgi:hypothetical protein